MVMSPETCLSKKLDGVFKQPYDPLISRPELEAMNSSLSLAFHTQITIQSKIEAGMSARKLSASYLKSFSSMAMLFNTHAALASAWTASRTKKTSCQFWITPMSPYTTPKKKGKICFPSMTRICTIKPEKPPRSSNKSRLLWNKIRSALQCNPLYALISAASSPTESNLMKLWAMKHCFAAVQSMPMSRTSLQQQRKQGSSQKSPRRSCRKLAKRSIPVNYH